MATRKAVQEQKVEVPAAGLRLKGILSLPQQVTGVILFAHGSGSSHLSPRNQMVSKFFIESGLGTLLFDLLTVDEEKEDMMSKELRFNIPFLANRLVEATKWMINEHKLKIGYFGASTGAAAAIVAADELKSTVSAVVSRGGRPDLAGQSLARVTAPTLLIVGGADYGVIELNQRAFEMMNCVKKVEIVPGATHLFEERGALEEVGHLATRWFEEYL